jgi:hypothetical protein
MNFWLKRIQSHWDDCVDVEFWKKNFLNFYFKAACERHHDTCVSPACIYLNSFRGSVLKVSPWRCCYATQHYIVHTVNRGSIWKCSDMSFMLKEVQRTHSMRFFAMCYQWRRLDCNRLNILVNDSRGWESENSIYIIDDDVWCPM